MNFEAAEKGISAAYLDARRYTVFHSTALQQQYLIIAHQRASLLIIPFMQ